MLVECGDIQTAWFEVGRGRPLILIHGLADDHRAWRKPLPQLILNHRVILYDLRGHGGTSLGRGEGTLAQLAGDLLSLMDALAIDRAVLAGFSLGGTVAMRVAIERPERVQALALVATSSRVGSAAAEWYRTRGEMAAGGDPELRATLDQDAADVYRNAPLEVEMGRMIRRQSTADPSGYANACRAMEKLHSHPLDPDLGRIAAPTLVVSADRDQHCPPRAGEIISAAVPGSRHEVIDGCGHPIPVEKPDRLATLIEELATASGAS